MDQSAWTPPRSGAAATVAMRASTAQGFSPGAAWEDRVPPGDDLSMVREVARDVTARREAWKRRGSERGGWRQPHLSLLGSFQLFLGDELTRLPVPSQRMIALLSLQKGRSVGRSYVAGTLWPEVDEASARSALRSALWKLGQVRDALVEVTNDDLRLRPDVTIDLRERRATAHRLLHDSRDGADLSPELFADDLLPQWSDDWVETERESYRQLRLHALEQLSERLAQAGRFGPAVDAGLLAVAGGPLRESAHRVVIRVLVMEGNRAEAHRRYEELSGLLQDEIGVEPSFGLEEIWEGV